MADFVQMLVDMGFPKDRAEYAVNVTNKQGVEPAMEWLLAHIDEALPVKTEETNSNNATKSDDASSSAAAPVTAETTAKSLKCEDCGKVMTNEGEIEYHAVKTGHKNFSESTEEKKPLTEEERKQQLALIEERLRLKRAEREERDKLEALEREKARIRSSKDLTEARRRNEEIEMKKLIDQRKREKADDKAARERVRAQIAADKAARKAKEQPQPSATITTTDNDAASVSSTSPNSVPAVKASPKEYSNTRIQVRLQDGSALTETFGVKEQLSAVRLFVQMKAGLDTPFRLMTSFPRKVFEDDDYEQTLEELKLLPSAVLIVTKGTV